MPWSVVETSSVIGEGSGGATIMRLNDISFGRSNLMSGGPLPLHWAGPDPFSASTSGKSADEEV